MGNKEPFWGMVVHNKAQLIYIEVCSNMNEKGYSLSAIAEIVPMVSKAEIYGLLSFVLCEQVSFVLA